MAATTIAVVLFVMYLLECMHPPGGATALVPVIATTAGPAPGLEFLLYPVGLNLLVMLSCALLLQRYWLKAKATSEGPGTPATEDAKPLDRLQLQHSDLAAAIERVWIGYWISAKRIYYSCTIERSSMPLVATRNCYVAILWPKIY